MGSETRMMALYILLSEDVKAAYTSALDRPETAGYCQSDGQKCPINMTLSNMARQILMRDKIIANSNRNFYAIFVSLNIRLS